MKVNLNLLMDKEVKVSKDLTINIPTIKQIRMLGEDTFNEYNRILAYDKSQYILGIEEAGLNYEDISELQLLYLLLMAEKNQDRNVINEAFNFYTGYNIKATTVFGKEKIFMYKQKGRKIELTTGLYEIMKETIRVINAIKIDELNFGNKRAKKYYLKQLKTRMKNQHSEIEKINLSSIISLLHWQTGISYEELDNYTIYQIKEGYERIGVIEEYTSRKNAMYHGKMNPKEVQLTYWAEILNNFKI